MNDLVARWAFIVSLENHETAVSAVPIDRLFKIAYADSGVEEFDHATE